MLILKHDSFGRVGLPCLLLDAPMDNSIRTFPQLLRRFVFLGEQLSMFQVGSVAALLGIQAETVGGVGL